MIEQCLLVLGEIFDHERAVRHEAVALGLRPERALAQTAAQVERAGQGLAAKDDVDALQRAHIAESAVGPAHGFRPGQRADGVGDYLRQYT